jgi:hypothetical protein
MPGRLPRLQRLRPWVLGGLGLYSAIWLALWSFAGVGLYGPVKGVVVGGDHLQFWAGAALLDRGATGAELYEDREFKRVQTELLPGYRRTYRPVYPPPLYQAARTTVRWPFKTAARLYLVLGSLLYALGVGLLVRGIDPLSGHRWTLLLIGWASPPMTLAINTGQAAGMWVLLLGSAAFFLSFRRDLVAGLLLGGLCAKPSLAAPIALALVLAARWRLLGGFVLGGALLLGGSVALDGLEPWSAYLHKILGQPELLDAVWVKPFRHITLRSLLAWPVPSGLQGLVGATGVGIGLAVAGWIGAAAVPHRRDPHTSMLALGASLSACLLAAPHLFDYDLGMHAIGFAAGARWILSGRARRPRVGLRCLTAVWITAWIGTPFAEHTRICIVVLALGCWLLWMGAELRWAAQRWGQQESELPPQGSVGGVATGTFGGSAEMDRIPAAMGVGVRGAPGRDEQAEGGGFGHRAAALGPDAWGIDGVRCGPSRAPGPTRWVCVRPSVSSGMRSVRPWGSSGAF